jgi:hypothetical protein
MGNENGRLLVEGNCLHLLFKTRGIDESIAVNV